TGMPQASFRVESSRNEIVGAGQALALRFNAEIVGDLLAHALAPCIAQLWHEKGVAVKLLAAIAIETVAAQELGVAIFCRAADGVDILGDQEPAGAADRFARGGMQSRHQAAGIFDGEVVHQVMPEYA